MTYQQRVLLSYTSGSILSASHHSKPARGFNELHKLSRTPCARQPLPCRCVRPGRSNASISHKSPTGAQKRMMPCRWPALTPFWSHLCVCGARFDELQASLRKVTTKRSTTLHSHVWCRNLRGMVFAKLRLLLERCNETTQTQHKCHLWRVSTVQSCSTGLSSFEQPRFCIRRFFSNQDPLLERHDKHTQTQQEHDHWYGLYPTHLIRWPGLVCRAQKAHAMPYVTE